MANKFRGESDLTFDREVDGVTQQAKFRLVFDANAFCEIEDTIGLTLGELHDAMSDPKKLSMKAVRAIVHGGLHRHHPDLTPADAGDIMSDAGMEETMAALRQAFGGAMKKASGEAKGQKTATRSGSRGTGTKR